MKKFLLVLSVLFLTLFQSCSKDKINEDSLNVSSTDVQFGESGGSKVIEVITTLESWKVLSTEQWIKISNNKSSFTIEASANTLNAERVASLEVLAGDLKIKISVKQAAAKDKLIKVDFYNNQFFEKSDIQNILDSKNAHIATLCLEYIKAENMSNRIPVIYTAKDGKIDMLNGISLLDGGTVVWDKANRTCKYTPGKLTNIKACYINKDNIISFTTPNIDNIVNAQVSAQIIIDKRAKEENSYRLVKIGLQYWMAENLKTKLYLDGSPIAHVINKEDWLTNTDGAFTYYDNKEENLNKMGGLYNWYAVTHTKGIAPKGYRVSTESDWALMAKYLDPQNYDLDDTGARESETIAPLLKSTDGWLANGSKSGNGNNLSGLNIKAYGSTSESKFMDFSGITRQAYFWTTQGYEAKTAMFRRLYFDEVFTNRWFENKSYGYSVRCVSNVIE